MPRGVARNLAPRECEVCRRSYVPAQPRQKRCRRDDCRPVGAAGPAAAAPPPLYERPVMAVLEAALRDPQVVKSGHFAVQAVLPGHYVARVLVTADEPVVLGESDRVVLTARLVGKIWHLRRCPGSQSRRRPDQGPTSPDQGPTPGAVRLSPEARAVVGREVMTA